MKKAGRKETATPENMIIGRQSVLEALRHGHLLKVFMAAGLKGDPVDKISSLARQKGVPLSLVSREELDNLVRGAVNHQGVAALAPPFRYLSLAELIKSAKSSAANPLLIALDHLQDPQNLGSIIRTADAAGVQGMIIPELRSVGITPSVRKVAAGAVERTRVARVKNLVRALQELKQEGFWIYGAEADGKVPYFQADYRVPLVLVAGSEGRGLSRLVRRHCDQTISIPMQGAAGSLNVAVAAAVLIYTAVGRREGWYR